VVTRGEDGVLRAFYNVCRHMRLRWHRTQGCAKHFAVRYHGWTYGNDGALKGMGGILKEFAISSVRRMD